MNAIPQGQLVGYARVSSYGQSLEAQQEALAKVGVVKLFEEKASGTSAKDRTELKALLAYVRPGDIIVITKIDRLARDLLDLLQMVKSLGERGIALRILDQNIDTSNAAGTAFLHMLGLFAEFENNLRKERQLAGIAVAKARGDFKPGRPRTVSWDAIRDMRDAGSSVAEIRQALGVTRQCVHKVLKKLDKQSKETAAP